MVCNFCYYCFVLFPIKTILFRAFPTNRLIFFHTPYIIQKRAKRKYDIVTFIVAKMTIKLRTIQFEKNLTSLPPTWERKKETFLQSHEFLCPFPPHYAMHWFKSLNRNKYPIQSLKYNFSNILVLNFLFPWVSLLKFDNLLHTNSLLDWISFFLENELTQKIKKKLMN